ncbi:hypothetical protein HNP33_002529 [Comamonas odontotermitis]|uniref:DUF4124 domain-containing protein n=1 Tax=Comamonas odontotermitis TaxID=379895 RepID=A0ABR6RH60_9BURK|nr:hypothetical protein [Comamonas odontotermitis]
MHQISRLIAACVSLVCAGSAFAVSRCDSGGRVTYQDGPCGSGSAARSVDTRPASGYGYGPRPHNGHYGYHRPARSYRQPSYGQEAWRYRSPAVNPYSSKNGPCPLSHEVHNAAVSASSIGLTPYERARQQDNVRMMETCR